MSRTSSLCFVVLVAFTLVSGGCLTAIVHDAVVESFPTYEETEQGWPPIREGEGRLVVYYLEVTETGALLWSGKGDSLHVTIDGNDDLGTSLLNRTFVFTDLPPGQHTVHYNQSRRSAVEHETVITISAGHVHYIEIDSHTFDGSPPKEVDLDHAQQELTNIHHKYKKLLRFDDQKWNARRAE